MNTNTGAPIVRFNFHGDDLDVVHLEGGDVGVSLKRLCEAVPIDYPSQRKRLLRAAKAGARWATVVKMTTVGLDGKPRTMLVLPRRSIPMWAATVDLGMVDEASRPGITEKLAFYQDQAADLLADHFLGRRRTDADTTALIGRLMTIVEAMDGRLRTIEEQGGPPALDVAGVGGANLIRARLQEYGRLMAVSGTTKERSRWRARGEMELRGHLNFVGAGKRWAALPAGDYPRARLKLDQMLRMAHESAVARGAPGGVVQGPLFGKTTPASA